MSDRKRSIQSVEMLIWQAHNVAPRSLYFGFVATVPAGRVSWPWRSICETERVP